MRFTGIPASGAESGLAKRTDAEHRDFARQLAAEKARLLAAQAVAKVGSWENELASGSLVWSDESHRIFGTTPANFLPTYVGFLGLVHPEDRAKVENAFVESLGKPGTHGIKHRILLADGRVKFVDERWSWTNDERGTPIRALGTCQDVTERTLAEHALRDSEERFASAFDDAPIGMALITIDGRWLMVNQSLCAMLGYTKLDLLTSAVQDITFAEDMTATQERLEALENRVIGYRHFRKRYRHALGHAVTTSVTTSVVRTSAGSPRYIIVQIEDITERERNEASLRIQAQMLESVGQAVISTDAQGVITYVNRFAENLYGWPAAEMIGRNVVETIAAQSSMVQAQEIMDALSLGESWKGEILVQNRDGRTFCVSATDAPVLDADGKLVAVVGIAEDITQRKQAVQELRDSEQKFRTLAESMPQIVWITEPSGGNLYFNQQWMDYTGLTLEESRGDGWLKPFHPDDRRRAWDAWQAATSTFSLYSLECRLRRADGEYHWWLIRGVPRRDADGNVIEWFGTCTDIHEFKHADLEMKRTNRALKLVIDASTAVIQTKSEPALLAEICRVAVEVGGYAMGWIGFAMDDEMKSIKPMAHAGAEDGYLAESTVTWDANDPAGQGPAGRAIRTGKIVVSGVFGDDATLAPWQRTASRLGYAGAIALPLRNSRRAYGVLALYWAAIGPPGEEELELLGKLANGVAFGINNLRARG